ncbi:hypothetical protein MBM_07713 [Drepanopeziza brunnea f. sp. 'multigermtubi' MB_m1]|uniref:Uncharacterized protein n=2 Tax=Drepanopeziza brunnea f. sp. 'multigermtubi' TaxID=698441 RepID=K1WMF0_MARBU|nr:uncharacterized protein MBM_07713 [Drepanopeziza brunnea f. sp. 'multigermtubi' MB_m1]EKD14036.1 hypothetical protein MBM_07713 [Drepanopeziza brunnea f. sp. 'multigermtubi' MB_m1]
MSSVLSENCTSPGFHSNMSSSFSTSPSPSPPQSQPPSPSPSPPPTIHNRRTLSSRTASDNHSSRRSPPPPALPGLGLPASPFAAANTNVTNTHSNPGESSHPNSRSAAAPIFVPQRGESDAECWEKMVALQREYHCYNSARLEAAVEALERGCMIEEVPMPSRFCLDLLNEGLQAQIESESESW